MNDHWQGLFQSECEKPYYRQLDSFLQKEYAEETIYPPENQRWAAFSHTAPEDVKVVILGQDPYHGPGQAHGLSFSVNEDMPIPPSLRNMFKELVADIACDMPENGSLTGWAKQGVLLLNTVLTVRKGQAHSHKSKGWEQFTDAVIRHLSNQDERIVFILWGKPAQEKKKLIDLTKHATVESSHPSPLSAYRGFLGSRPYSQTNAILRDWGKEPIDWQRTNR